MRLTREGRAGRGAGGASRVLRTGLCLSALLVASGAGAASASATPGIAAWGDALGNGSGERSTAPVPVSSLVDATSVVAGEGFDLALFSDGTVQSWGNDTSGDLGDGDVGLERPVPGPVSSLTHANSISAGADSALAVLRNGTVEAWGSQPSPTAEDESVTLRTPQAVPGIAEAVAAAVGSDDRELKKTVDDGQFNLVLLANGEVLAWGNDEHGQLGDAGNEYSGTPITVSGLTNVTAIAAGGGQGLALLSDGHVMAWGENAAGQLGDGKSGKRYDSDVPVEVQGLSEVAAIAAGGEDSLALLKNGTVMAWGSNQRGELGKSTLEASESDVPVQVPGLEHVAAISAGSTDLDTDTDHNLALLGDGDAMAWGENKYGQLGNGEVEGKFSYEPVPVSGLEGASSVAAGDGNSVAAGPAVPVVTSITPEQGPVGGGTAVTVSGYNLAGATSVQFGRESARNIEADTETSLIAVSPPFKPRKVEITVTTAAGTSGASEADRYRYVPEGVLEFGRCESLRARTGRYGKGCTVEEARGKYEWQRGAVKSSFTVTRKKPFVLESAKGELVTCTGTTGTGEYVGGKSVANVVLVFTDCINGKGKKAVKCTTAGLGAGELETAVLEGGIGFDKEAEDKVAFELLPAVEGQAFLSFTCGSTPVTVTGGVFGSIGRVDSSRSSFTVTYLGSHGNQRVKKFETGPEEALEATIGEGSPEKANIAGALNLINEETLEINSVV